MAPTVITASTPTMIVADQSTPVPRRAVATIAINAKYAQMPSSESDWNVAARESRKRHPWSCRAPSANKGADSATETPRHCDSASAVGDPI